MVSAKSVEEQLKRIRYNRGWNKPETDELATILLPDEEIFECVNGWYEGGFALLCATNVRVLLIDKKPFKFLTVEDVRFDTINQIDYSHRLFNANICITAGLKNLSFRSYNQPRLRELISHVQHRMAEIQRSDVDKAAGEDKEETGLRGMDHRLKAYLVSQYEQHQAQKLSHQENSATPAIEVSRESEGQTNSVDITSDESASSPVDVSAVTNGVSSADLYQDGVKEIFRKYEPAVTANEPIKSSVTIDSSDPLQSSLSQNNPHVFDTNPLKIACSKLPMILRSKRRPRTASSLWTT